MRRILLVIEYDGTDYHGFQRQDARLRTVQGELEAGLARVLGEEVTVAGAGRTDARVHAIGQAATFDTNRPIPVENVVGALNSTLPGDVTVVSAEEVALSFHPRRDAKRKQYCYRILNRTLPSPFINRYAWHLREPLDAERMQAAADRLVGEHDFAAFCASGSTVKTTVRKLQRVDVAREGDTIEVRIEGNGFLYMMVRIIVGTLVEVGAGRMSAEQVAEILAGGDRRAAARTAPPQGLTLIEVSY